MLSITKEDIEFGGTIVLFGIVIITPVLSFISTMLIGYFDPRRKSNKAWAKQRNWIMIIICIVLTVTVATYEVYAPYLPKIGFKDLTIAHLFFTTCYLIITKELIGVLFNHNMTKRVMFILFVNTLSIAQILLFID